MRARITKLAAGLAALTALAAGGAAIAGAAGKQAPPTNPPVASQSAPAGANDTAETPGDAVDEETGGVDSDNVQQGDQSTPDRAAESASETAVESSEAGPSDGPGGYADSGVNADTQQEGQN